MIRTESTAVRWPTLRAPSIAAAVVAGYALCVAGFVLLGLPLWTLTIVCAAVCYLLVVLLRPSVGLLTVVAVFFVPIQVASGVSLLQSIGAVTAGLLLIWFLYQQRSIALVDVLLPLLLLGILILASLQYTLDAGRTMFYFKKWLFNMAFVLLLTNMVTRFDVFKQLIWCVMVMAAANAAFGMYDYAVNPLGNYRSTGLMENANSFGHLAVLAFPLAMYQYLYRTGARRWLGLGLAAVLAGGIVVSVSRGAVVSLLLVSLTMLVLERRRVLPLLLVFALGAVSVPFLPDYFHKRVGNLVTDVKKSVLLDHDGADDLTSRGYLNSGGIKIWMAHPILGVGMGNFGHYFVEKEFNPGFRKPDRTIAHNIYVQALSETGIVGTGLLAWLILLTSRHILRARRACRHDRDRWIYFGAVEMMALAIFLSTATYGSLMNNDFWMFIALTAVSSRVAAGHTAAAGMA